jgi:hypothetical protein
VPARLFPVFRDREELAGASSLGGEIEEAFAAIALIDRDLLAARGPRLDGWARRSRRSKAMGRESRVLSLIRRG